MSGESFERIHSLKKTIVSMNYYENLLIDNNNDMNPIHNKHEFHCLLLDIRIHYSKFHIDLNIPDNFVVDLPNPFKRSSSSLELSQREIYSLAIISQEARARERENDLHMLFFLQSTHTLLMNSHVARCSIFKGQ